MAENMTVFIAFYFLWSVTGAGIVLPSYAYMAADEGKISWGTAHLVMWFTFGLPCLLTVSSAIYWHVVA